MSTYYISTTGSDSASGSPTTPWKTLQKASSAKAGDTVIVNAGTYNAGLNLFGHTGGTSTSPITLKANGVVNITHCATTGTNASLAGINIESTGGYFVIDGFKITGDGSMQRAGIRVATSNNCQIINNNVSSAFIGIFTSSSSGLLIQNNICTKSTDQHGIYVGAGTTNSTIRGNECANNNWDGIHMNASNSLGMNDGNIVENNYIHNNNLSGMDIEGIRNAILRNNVICNNTKHGMSFHSQDQTAGGNPTPACINNSILNNTIIGNGLFGVVFRKEDMVNTKILNNVLISTSSIYGSMGFEAQPTGITSDYNIVVDNFSTTLGTTKMTFAQWKTSSGQDAHSLIATSAQLFVAPTTNDYHLKTGSPAINAGTNTTFVSVDKDGKARPQGTVTDIGAFEFAETVVPPPPPPDTTAPVVSNVSVSNIGQNSAVISWSTDETSNSQVDYGVTISYGAPIVNDSAMVTNHSLTLSGLSANTQYHFKVRSTDVAGNAGSSSDTLFTTLPVPDTTPPAISNFSVDTVTENSAKLSWLTNEPSSTQFDYSGLSYVLGTLTTNHSVELIGLAAGTTYDFTAKAKDASSNESVLDGTFTTLTPPPQPDTDKPMISNVSVSDVTLNSALVSWTTNEDSTTCIEYGLDDSYTNLVQNNMLVTSHSVLLSGLKGSTEYHYRVKSVDAAGNESVALDSTFITEPLMVSSLASITATYDGTVLKLFINDVKVAETAS